MGLNDSILSSYEENGPAHDELLESEEGRELVRALAGAESDKDTSDNEPISASSSEE